MAISEFMANINGYKRWREFALVAIVDKIGVDWREMCQLELSAVVDENNEYKDKKSQIIDDQINIREFEFIEGHHWELLLFKNFLNSYVPQNFGEFSVIVYGKIAAKYWINIENIPNHDQIRKIIYIEFYLRSTKLIHKKIMLDEFKKCRNDFLSKFNLIEKKYIKNESNKKDFAYVCKSIGITKNDNFTFNDLLYYCLNNNKKELFIFELYKKINTRINNEKRKDNGQTTQISLWIKPETKSKISKYAKLRNISRDNLIDFIFENNEMIEFIERK